MARVKACGIRMLLFFIQSISILVEPLGAAAQAESHEGLAAYVHGDYALAARLFRPLADAGDVESQFLLGLSPSRALLVTRTIMPRPYGISWRRRVATRWRSSVSA
jgi:hypothetical protein